MKQRPPYEEKLAGMQDDTLLKARERWEEILALPPRHMDKETVDRLFSEVPGLLPRLRK